VRTLLHICCAPCSIECIEALRAEGQEMTGFWFNPNIHPVTEYRARLEALKGYAQKVNLPLLGHDRYGLRDFVRAVSGDLDDRCGVCYEMRLEEAAGFAAAHGFEAFTTTLLISPYQNHEKLIETGKRAAQNHGVEFLERDFRPRFREGQRRARELELYMQKYCGCVFSEEERYHPKASELG
jgi:predicted adenine nucleotide alpha hydrolase (AANH) superfamily ATPase